MWGETHDWDMLEVESEDIRQAFQTIVPSACIYNNISGSKGVGACWTGELYLDIFIENLPKLKVEAPYLYNYLVGDYKCVINDSKKLIAKLKLQDLPIPWVEVKHNNSSYYHKKTTKYNICVEDGPDTWDYFYNSYEDEEISEIKIREEKYLDEVGPVLIDICEALASIIYKHLTKVSENT